MRVEQVIQQVQEKVPGTQPKSSQCYAFSFYWNKFERFRDRLQIRI